MRRAHIVFFSLVLALAVPACGSDDDGGGGTGGASGSGGSSGNGGSSGSGGSAGSGGSGGSAGSGGSSGAGGSSGSGGSAGVAGSSGTGGQSSAYPPGPYGKEVGDTVANYAFQGYVNDAGDAISTTKPFVASYTMDDLRKSGKQYAFLHVAQFF
jgi:hypothetical protein